MVAGVTQSVVSAVHNHAGHFPNGVERGFNTFAFFTTQSNLLVGASSLYLAVRLDRTSTAFKTIRLMGLVAISLTGVVFHVALGRLLDLDGWDWLGNQLVHTVVPLLAVVGWLIVGPRGLTSARIAKLSVLFPAGWLAFTLIRGAVVHWYPYPFIDVNTIGYGKAILNCFWVAFWVALLLFGLGTGFTVVDRRLDPPAVDGTSDEARTGRFG